MAKKKSSTDIVGLLIRMTREQREKIAAIARDRPAPMAVNAWCLGVLLAAEHAESMGICAAEANRRLDADPEAKAAMEQATRRAILAMNESLDLSAKENPMVAAALEIVSLRRIYEKTSAGGET